MSGYNEMRWKCEQLGCFNRVARPKIEMFGDCFPRRICMGDLDGIVEINGKCLVLEWKHAGHEELETGQRIMFDALIRAPDRMFTVLCVCGDAMRMQVYSARHYTGPSSTWERRDLEWCKLFMRRWSNWADLQVYA